MKQPMLTTAFFLMTLAVTDASAQQKPITGYAPINGLHMYYESTAAANRWFCFTAPS
jgi:hypothetical protein